MGWDEGDQLTLGPKNTISATIRAKQELPRWGTWRIPRIHGTLDLTVQYRVPSDATA